MNYNINERTVIGVMSLAIGIMSGTSLDGIDIVLAKINGTDENTKIQFIDGITVPWENSTYNMIKKSISLEESNVEIISKLNYKIPHEYYEGIKKLINKNNILFTEIDFISIHGQTIWHDPNNIDTPSTLQIGSGTVLSALAKTTVISNFRIKDIVYEGQGAPLIPYVDNIIFESKNKVISAHNLGGISNLTILKNNKIIKAFDTGPANMMIDFFMKTLFDKSYDHGGETAQRGNKIKPMYDEVMKLYFFKLPPPKSTGRELFGDQYSKYLLEKYSGYSNEDYVRTVTDITIDSIVMSYRNIIKKYDLDEIIFSGGGSHNDFVLSEIAKLLPEIKIAKSDKYGISVDFKEALGFVILGNQTYNLKPVDLTKATGSKQKIILGEVSFY